jgi:hypothetical protein
MINTDPMHHLKISWHSYMCFFSHFDLIPHQQWQMMASGSSMYKQQQKSGGHYSNRQIVNSGRGL